MYINYSLCTNHILYGTYHRLQPTCCGSQPLKAVQASPHLVHLTSISWSESLYKLWYTIVIYRLILVLILVLTSTFGFVKGLLQHGSDVCSQNSIQV